MRVILQDPLDFNPAVEYRANGNHDGVPLHSESIADDLADLIDETYTTGLLSGRLPFDHDEVRVWVRPGWGERPLLEHIAVELAVDSGQQTATYQQTFSAGRWQRRLQQCLAQLREEGSLGEDQTVYRSLVSLSNGRLPDVRLPRLEPPAIVDQSLEDFGVRKLGTGHLVPDRPILVNARFEQDAIEMTEQSGPRETGAAALGKLIRLPEPLPGTESRIVTLLSALVSDARHAAPTTFSFAFSPDALAEATQIAAMRGMGESVLTVFHSHGWGTSCGNCNENDKCLLPECTLVSLDDYRVMESLVPTKSAVMPIAGRRVGAEGRHPVLAVHAWRGGQMRPLRWQRYED